MAAQRDATQSMHASPFRRRVSSVRFASDSDSDGGVRQQRRVRAGAVECVCARLAESVSRAGAHESLRRDRHARALLDIPAPSWYRLLRIILGSPDASLTGTNASRGVLLRLLIGESLRHLLADVDLAVAVTVAAPGVMRGRS